MKTALALAIVGMIFSIAGIVLSIVSIVERHQHTAINCTTKDGWKRVQT